MGVLRARLALAQGGGAAAEARPVLLWAIRQGEHLEAPRDLALAYLACAWAAAEDGAEVPATWLARAQPLLVRVGTAEELRLLRRAFRALGRRTLDRVVDADAFAVMDTLRERYARLRDVLAAQHDAWACGEPPAAGLARGVEASLASVQLAEEAMIATTEHTLLERERISQFCLLYTSDAADE